MFELCYLLQTLLTVVKKDSSTNNDPTTKNPCPTWIFQAFELDPN
jgi:hypothetical protein